jgi:hypothetical protein
MQLVRPSAVDLCPKTGTYTLIHQPVTRLVGGWALERRNPTTIPLLALIPSAAYFGFGQWGYIPKPFSLGFFHHQGQHLCPPLCVVFMH